ncbi:MAG: hypothetical protein R3272_08455 [Candidatus Promineifilaceae bacterium]|nr:hypothetical protein [Candidatus Promineifilaceae bacterium]
MSDLNLILDAIMADIPPNIASDIGDEIWSAHHKFQVTLLEAMAGHPDAQNMIDRYREQPDVYGSVLSEAIVHSGALDDPAVVETAGEVMALVAPLDADTESDDLMNVPGTYASSDVSAEDI